MAAVKISIVFISDKEPYASVCTQYAHFGCVGAQTFQVRPMNIAHIFWLVACTETLVLFSGLILRDQ